MLKILMALVLVSLATPAAMAQTESESPTVSATSGFKTIDNRQLADMLEAKAFLFVNVHVPFEGEIDGTDQHIPFDRVTDNLDKFPSDKTAEIVLYCQSGRMSEIAATELSRLGYTNVSHVAGGMIGWQAIGGEIVGK